LSSPDTHGNSRLNLRVAEILNLAQFPFPELFADAEPVWGALQRLARFVSHQVHPGNAGRVTGNVFLGPHVQIGEGTVVEHGAVIQGPAIIGRNCEIRAHAYLRENVIVGDQCVLGNACEFKNALLFNNSTVPHFSYVGDSILGYKAHLGAGVILSNVKSTSGTVTVEGTDTGLRKLGAIIGDEVDIGCNCVLNPGSIIGRGSVLYPNVLWRGVCPPRSVVKLRQQHEVACRRR